MPSAAHALRITQCKVLRPSGGESIQPVSAPTTAAGRHDSGACYVPVGGAAVCHAALQCPMPERVLSSRRCAHCASMPLQLHSMTASHTQPWMSAASGSLSGGVAIRGMSATGGQGGGAGGESSSRARALVEEHVEDSRSGRLSTLAAAAAGLVSPHSKTSPPPSPIPQAWLEVGFSTAVGSLACCLQPTSLLCMLCQDCTVCLRWAASKLCCTCSSLGFARHQHHCCCRQPCTNALPLYAPLGRAGRYTGAVA